MFAIVNIAGQQMKVKASEFVYVNRLPQAEGEAVELNEVLLVSDDKKTNVGKPFIKGATVKAKVLGHLKADKVIVFKKKRRKGYKKTNGHRQQLTKLQIESIKS